MLAAALFLTACGSSGSTGSAALSDSTVETPQEPFADYNPEFKPPPGKYDKPLFKLSQDYPTQMPTEALPVFFKTDFRTDWRTYTMQVREYCFEGNTDVDWHVEKNEVRPWYNMPWQDYGDNGREAIRGLTREAPIKAFQLADSQDYGKGNAYAIGFYNGFGAYTIGQVWKDHENPDPAFASTEGFPIGTVVCKLLFLNMPTDIVQKQIDFLVNPIEWEAYTDLPRNSSHEPEKRAVQNVTLIQLDIMVRDERATSGWVFGTFQYNGALENNDRWRNLAPVGLMWGNDPEETAKIPEASAEGQGSFPALKKFSKTPENPDLDETVINQNRSELPPTHLGWNGRLNGPADNFLSSCMSCHMTSSYPEKFPLAPSFPETKSERPKTGTPDWDKWWMQWFQNVGWKNGVLEKFRNSKLSLDFSLQLSDSLQNFYKKKGIPPPNPVRR